MGKLDLKTKILGNSEFIFSTKGEDFQIIGPPMLKLKTISLVIIAMSTIENI
jgi:hypothetical protein